jgi:hypothetical protein
MRTTKGAFEVIRQTMSAAVAGVAAVAVLASAPAVANEGDVTEAGQCSQFGRYDLKLSPQNGRIEVEFEVDVNRTGQRYRVSLFHGERRVRQGVFTTRGLSGSFSVRDLEPNRRGGDRIRARAVRVGGGNRCGGSARF